MKYQELIQKFFQFFREKEHKIVPSSSLIPENDPTVLFTTAGMHPLIPYLLGQEHPLGKRLCSVQRCIRTVDIDEVGDKSHLTFFEMLGNWSLGDYFKKEAIEWSYQFLMEELKLDKKKIAVSIFKGEGDIPPDEESKKIWKELGISSQRIKSLGREENWWDSPGQSGPCGPDTEIFYWIAEGEAPEEFDPENKNWLEIWNNVFMEYNKEEGKYLKLDQKNVDTGMGLERVLVILNKKDNVFETEVFQPIMEEINKLKEKEDIKKERIIADHLKAAVFILSEKLKPSNTERGYVLRRLIRKAVRYGKLLGIKDNFSGKIAEAVIDIYPELKENKNFIIANLKEEEGDFKDVLDRGIKEFNKLKGREISGERAFDLYQSYGFPLEMTKEMAERKDMKVDEEGFRKELKKHQEISREASAKRFKSGLADHSDKVVKYHTATHLLHQSLRRVLGEQVEQKGSNITSERLRFDFSFERKMSDQEKKEVEDLVNRKIKENLEVKKEEMSLKEALKSGALALFKNKYPERVFVYTIRNPKTKEIFSKEICSGPHVEKTGELGNFKIVKEESSAKGIRRIKAVLD